MPGLFVQIHGTIEARRTRVLSRFGCARIAAITYISPKRPGIKRGPYVRMARCARFTRARISRSRMSALLLVGCLAALDGSATGGRHLPRTGLAAEGR